MTGENSFIRLSKDGGQTVSTRLSHWRVLWCPAGAGHVLFIQSDLTGDQLRVYSDNAGVARWLQDNIETYLSPPSADRSLPIISACFSRYGDPRGTATELIMAGDDVITMTWYECIEPFVLTSPPGEPPERPIGVFSTFFPAQGAQVELNGKFAEGEVWAQMRGDQQSTSACLALSETWVKPKS